MGRNKERVWGHLSSPKASLIRLFPLIHDSICYMQLQGDSGVLALD